MHNAFIGREAPDFTLLNSSGGGTRLSDLRGKRRAVLFFFSAAFTGV